MTRRSRLVDMRTPFGADGGAAPASATTTPRACNRLVVGVEERSQRAHLPRGAARETSGGRYARYLELREAREVGVQQHRRRRARAAVEVDLQPGVVEHRCVLDRLTDLVARIGIELLDERDGEERAMMRAVRLGIAEALREDLDGTASHVARRRQPRFCDARCPSRMPCRRQHGSGGVPATLHHGARWAMIRRGPR